MKVKIIQIIKIYHYQHGKDLNNILVFQIINNKINYWSILLQFKSTKKKVLLEYLESFIFENKLYVFNIF